MSTNKERLQQENESLIDVLESLDIEKRGDLAIILRVEERLRQMASDPEFLAIDSFLVTSDPSKNLRPLEWNREYGFVEIPNGEPLTAVEVLRDFASHFIAGGTRTRKIREYFEHLLPNGAISDDLRDKALDEINLTAGEAVYESKLEPGDLVPALRRNYQRTAESCFRGLERLPVGREALAAKIKKIKHSI